MKSFIISVIVILSFSSCVRSQNMSDIKVGDKTPGPNEAVATFAEGCFWHSEIIFQSLVGVRDAVSGYSGGTAVNPSYEEVCGGNTGHAEAVQVYYDPAKISYESLVKAYFASLDPTTRNRQGNDAGTQYRSVVFYRNAKEKQVVDAEIARINSSGKYSNKVVTEVTAFQKFYPAEEYHQEYVHNHPDNGYVHNVTIPDFEEFKRDYKGNFKK